MPEAAGRGRPVVDRVPGAVSALYAFWAFGCAISAAGAPWAGRRRSWHRRKVSGFVDSRKGAPGHEEMFESQRHPVTFGPSGAASGRSEQRGSDLGRCEFKGHVNRSKARFCRRPG